MHLSTLAAMVVHGNKDILAKAILEVNESMTNMAYEDRMPPTVARLRVQRTVHPVEESHTANDVRARRSVIVDEVMHMARAETMPQVANGTVKMTRMATNDKAK